MIIGDGIIPEAECVRDVQAAVGDDVVLLSHMARILGQKIPPGATLYNLEPLFDGCRSLTLGYLDVLRGYKVWDYQAKNVAFLASHGIEATHVPYRYTKALERRQDQAKDIDVLFIGSQSPRRADILSSVAKKCETVAVQGCYGKELDKLISRARIVLNIHYCHEPHPLEVVRLNYLMANGCFVISEPGWDAKENEEYSPGLVFTEDIPSDCFHWLSKDKSSVNPLKTIRGMPMRLPEESTCRG